MSNAYLGYPDDATKRFLTERYWNKVWNSILHFTAEVDNSSVAMVRSDNGWDENFKLECSVDRGAWEPWNGFKVDLDKGHTVYIRAVSTNSKVSEYSPYYKFVMTGKIVGGGSIQYLIDKTGKNLNLSGLGYRCYYNMFNGCTSLTTAPQLPAQTLIFGCYDSMFSSCTSLITAPQLPAKTIDDVCYCRMFQNCTSLTAAPELPAQTLRTQCYFFMFENCTSLIVAPELPAQKFALGCYQSMFYNCTKLKIREGGTEGTKVLDLPVGTEAKTYWNSNMFSGTGGTFTGDPEIGKAYYCYQ